MFKLPKTEKEFKHSLSWLCKKHESYNRIKQWVPATASVYGMTILLSASESDSGSTRSSVNPGICEQYK